MKRLFLASLFLLFTCLYAYGDTEVVNGGGVLEGTDVDFTSIKVESGAKLDLAIKLGDGDSGFYEFDDDTIKVTLADDNKYSFDVNGFGPQAAYTPSLRTIAGTTTSPSLAFGGDENTGASRSAPDQFSLISGGIEGIRIYKNGVDLKTGVAFSGISSITADYVIGNFITDPTFFIECDATLGNISTTLPPVADKSGRLIEMKLTSAANGCYFDGDGAETIDGASGQAITTQYNVISLIAGATEWLIR
ncbi:hypothetical protein KAR91_69285 [Candidatus Pacearchaeota archaeon]|nr:hypothetical protein [Candidatus Pacearchaeota archaeon]